MLQKYNKYKFTCRAPRLKNLFLIVPRPYQRFNQKKSPPTGSESDLRMGIKNPCLVGVGSLLRTDLSGANRWVCPYCTATALRGCSLYCMLLACATHTCNLYYCLPLVWHADTYVCYLEYHAQAQLTEAGGIVLNKVYYLQLGPVL